MDKAEIAAAGEPIFRDFLIAIVLNAQTAAERLGMHLADVQAVNLLAVTGPLPAGQLGQRLGLPTATTTRVIDRLERAGYVERQRDPDDRRRVMVALDAERASVVDAVFEPSRRHLSALMPHYTEAELRILYDMFVRVTHAFRAATEEMRTAPR